MWSQKDQTNSMVNRSSASPVGQTNSESKGPESQENQTSSTVSGSPASPVDQTNSESKGFSSQGAQTSTSPVGETNSSVVNQNFSGVDQVYWQSAESVLSVFISYILPMMFGVLGTMIGGLRKIQARVRDSELTPRNYLMSVIGIPLGAVAGVAVGLFFTPSQVPPAGSGELGATLTLTATGLGFLGGYASQIFFRFLDDLLARVFTYSSYSSSSRQSPGTNRS